ncbi:MAG: response regulator [Gammaproteobacteria bacterium]
MAAHILVVEDQRSIAGAMRMRLRGLGYDVLDIARTGDEAVEKATSLRPDLILMDIRLGEGIDGIEAARRIRAKIDIPVIYVTAYADRELLERARDTHPAGFINKPYTTKDLLTTINLALAQENIPPRPLVLLRDGVITAARDGRIEFINSAAERITGWSHHQVKDRPLREVLCSLHGLSPTQGDGLIAELLADGGERYLNEPEHGDVLTLLTDSEGQCTGFALHIGADSLGMNLGTARRTQRALLHLLDQIELGVVIVDRDLRVTYHNRVAQRVAGLGRGVVIEQGRLELADGASYESLRVMVRDATAPEAPVDPDAADLLLLEEKGTPRIAVVVTRGMQRESVAGDPLATVLLFDLAHRPQLSGSALRELFGLTRTEVSLVQALAGGTSLEDGAQELGIAVNTARTHLKHIFHKTGARRQSELIHQIETGPPSLPLRIRRRH